MTLKVFSIGAMVKINSTSGLMDTSIPHLHQKIGDQISWDTTTMTSLVKIGGRLRHVERSTCLRSIRLLPNTKFKLQTL